MENTRQELRATENSTSAVAVLRQNRQRIQDYFVDFAHPKEASRRLEIRDLALSEIRIHRTLVDEIFLPAVRKAIEDPSAYQPAQQAMEDLTPLLDSADRMKPENHGFSAAWRHLTEEVAKALDKVEKDLVEPAQGLTLDFIGLGLEMIELRGEILAELPVKSVPTDNDPRPSTKS